MDNIRFKILISCLYCLPLATLCQVKQKNNLPPVIQPDTSKNTLLVPFNPQDTGKNSSGQFFTLQQCIDYAMTHQPGVNKALINVGIAKETNGVNLSGWLPQATASGDMIHYLQTSSSGSVSSPGTTTPSGASTSSSRGQYTNTFIPGISVSQAIFSPTLLYAYKSAPLYLKQAQLVTDSTKIFLVSSVSKSFYNVLLTLEQINILKEDTTRLGKNVRDAYHQYKGGIVDETDYEEAAITLNNSRAQLKQANENVVPQYAALKQQMGFPVEKEFNVSFDTVQMIKGIYIDTAQQLKYEKRIEFQQVETSKALQTQAVNYYRTSYLPTLSAFYNYNLAFQNNRFSNLLSNSYPSQLVGLSFSIPIFTGFSRTHNLQKAKLQQQLIGWDEIDLKLQINKEYKTAIANYKGNFYNLQLLQKNVAMAKRVYFVVTLQYKQGIVPYLNVITAESNLITSETSYLNALFQLLSSKIDLEKSMGIISY
ncbi:TolC family protein [Mucilaginibacter sp. OK098]|uniref:TolC family protein n=1 Tax=Mucilaginibacter sp. OK098 TaxID=1855297 RepID=UPI000911AA26|nr:TolC family protein [Mucilaginibacter sp. OK098]SHN27235.1 Outer membrane protein TolC [Mucilaginibacter sp. OK098]